MSYVEVRENESEEVAEREMDPHDLLVSDVSNLSGDDSDEPHQEPEADLDPEEAEVE